MLLWGWSCLATQYTNRQVASLQRKSNTQSDVVSLGPVLAGWNREVTARVTANTGFTVITIQCTHGNAALFGYLRFQIQKS